MGDHLSLEVMMRLSNSGMSRLEGLSRPSMAILTGFIPLPSPWTAPQLLQDLVTIQFVCGTFKQGSAIASWTRGGAVSGLASPPPIPNTSYPSLVVLSNGGTLMATKSSLHTEASHAAFSSDGTHLVLCGRRITTVQNSDSGAIVAKFPTDSNNPNDDSDDDL
jgi:hypothetical protein